MPATSSVSREEGRSQARSPGTPRPARGMAARNARAFLGILLVLFASGGSAGAISRTDSLPRRTFLGAEVTPLDAAARAERAIPAAAGVEVKSILPGSPAERAGLRPGDVLLTVEGVPIATPADLVSRTNHRKPGTTLRLRLNRDHKQLNRTVRLQEVPRESSPLYDVIYGHVTTSVGRLRTLLTKPRTRGPHPALFIVQGIGVFSVERVAGGIDFYGPIVEEFATHGFVTLRLDKPGCGDSEGGPLRDVDFDTQLDGFRRALAMLSADPDVDPGRILIFGHSMGGVWGPLLAGERPIRGIAVYGTFARTWLEYALENGRRQAALAGTPAGEIDGAMHREAEASHYLYAEKMSPKEMVRQHPELRGWVEESFTDETYYSGLHYRFLQQLSDKNLAAAWEAFPGSVLAVWGKADFLSGEVDHRLIARIANARRAGSGEFIALDDSDHGFFKAGSAEESFKGWGNWGRERNWAIVSVLRDWAARIGAEDAR